MTFEELQKANKEIKTMPIHNKQYAEVPQRIKAFRMVHPNGCIQTDIVSVENGVVIFKATVKDEEGRILGTGTAYEKEGSSNINKTSYIENCETSAIGRALGVCGFGIDMHLGSYEEVATAIMQQEEMEHANDKIGEIKARTMIPRLEKCGVNIPALLKQEGIEKLEDMTEARFSVLHNELVKKGF